MNKKYRIVLVGCGAMGAAHLDDIYYRDEIEISGVVDLDPGKAQAFKKKYNAEAWDTDYSSFLKDPAIDIFIICTYASSHLAILRACLAYGKHVLCEKPIATNRGDAQQFTELVKSADSKVLIGHILRHNNTYKKAAEMIHSGAIGELRVMRMVQNHHTKDWGRYKRLLKDASPIVDCGVHYIDIMQWFTGSRVASINGIGARTESDMPEDSYNYGMICMRFENGAVGYYEAGWGNTVAAENMKEFIGTRGRIRIIYRKDRPSHQEEGDLIEYYTYPDNEYRMINIDAKRKPAMEQLKHLIRMIEEGVDAVPCMEEVYSAFQLVMAADDAIMNGYMVKCP